MAIRGAGGDLNREERRRLQEYEDSVDQDYDPFHEKCGKDVFFSDKRLIATRRSDQWANGMAFSAKPIPLGGIFQVKLLETCVEWRSEILAIGFTSQDPDTMDPEVITNTDLRESKYYWLFWGSTVYHGGEKKKLPSSILSSSFVEGDTIGCCIRGGDLEIFINGQEGIVGWHNVPVDKPLWGAVEIYGKARTIQSEFYCAENHPPNLCGSPSPKRYKTSGDSNEPAPKTGFHERMDSSTGENQPPLLTSMEESSRVTHQPMSSQYSGRGSSETSLGCGNITPHIDIQRDYSSTSHDQQPKTILKSRRQLHHGELEACYDQNEGQRCVPAQEEAEIFMAVFRITVDNPGSGKWHGSGCFVEKKGSYWILTACHNLLNKSDGEKLKEGNFQRIEHLEEKMKENLLFTSFVLPDEQLKLTNEKDVVDVVGDISHVPLIYDPENDILAIPCNNPEGFGGTSFQLKVDAMQEYNPQIYHYLHIVHNPWKIAKPEDVDKVLPNEYVQHSIGMISRRIEGKAMMYDMVTYPGSSGSPVFFAGYNGLILVGIHQKCSDSQRLNQGSHLTEEFVERMQA